LQGLCAALSACTIAALLAPWARAAEGSRRPNILFLLSDDQRPDTIAALGNPVIQTPHLDSLVRTGTAFTRAFCPNPICTPSRAEILTGCSGFRNGVLDFGGKIDQQLPLWPEVLQNAGYHTWYVGKWHNDGRPTGHGYAQTSALYAGGGARWARENPLDWKGRAITGYRGWVFQDDQGNKFPDKGVGLTPNISHYFADAAIELIQRPTERPFFLHVNFTAPHDPLLMPPGYEALYPPEQIRLPANFRPQHPFDHGNLRGRDERLLPWPRTRQDVREELAMYYRVISHMDEQIGRILRALKETGQADRTLVIFASDHGLAVGSHGLRGKQNMYEHTIGVPLIMRGPGVPKGQRRDALVYLRDLFPTTCDLLDLEIPETIEGVSLAEVITGERRGGRQQIYGYFRDRQRMVRTPRWKLIHYLHLDRYQLFDLQADPDELHDLARDPRHAARRNGLRKRLLTWRRAVDDPALEP
jgi:arylsulfatase A-like enzyme